MQSLKEIEGEHISRNQGVTKDSLTRLKLGNLIEKSKAR